MIAVSTRQQNVSMHSSSRCLLGTDMQKRLCTVNSSKNFADDFPQLLRSISLNVCANLTRSPCQCLQKANSRDEEEIAVSGDIQRLEPKQTLLVRLWATQDNSHGQSAVSCKEGTARSQ